MAGAGRDTIQKLLKEFYIPPIVRQINDEVLMLSRLESTSDGIVPGNFAVVPLDYGRTGGIGPARERGALPAAGKQLFDRAIYNLKYLYGRGEVTGPSVATTQSDAGSFARVLKVEADGLKRDLRKDLARQVYGGYNIASAGGVDGSAAISKVASVAGAVITLTSDEALRHGWHYKNQVLNATVGNSFTSIRGTAGAGGTGAMTVVSVNLATPSITVNAAAPSLATGDFLVLLNAVDASGNAGLTGLTALIDSTSIVGGINPATAGNEYWASLVDTTGGAFDSDRLMQVWNQVRIASGEEPRSVITTYGITRAYFNELQGQVQYVEPMKLEGGFRVLNFMDRPFIGDTDAPFGHIFLPDETAIKVFSTGDFAPLDEDGSFLHWVTGFDMWEWALFRYMELGMTRRNSSAKLTGITDPGY